MNPDHDGLRPTADPEEPRLPAQVAPRPPPRAVWEAMFDAFVHWAGEAAIGLIPLLAHEVVAGFGKAPTTNVTPELCILTVVISGLAIFSLLRFGPHQRRLKLTALTYLMALF